MDSLNDLYKTASPPADTGAKKLEPSAPAPVTGPQASFEAPPGLPREYIEANFSQKDFADIVRIPEPVEKPKPLTSTTLGSPTIMHKDVIPYFPGSTAKIVQDRIDQGPRTFVSGAAKEEFAQRGQDEVSVPKSQAKIAHPDTLVPGRYIKGDSPPYRPC